MAESIAKGLWLLFTRLLSTSAANASMTDLNRSSLVVLLLAFFPFTSFAADLSPPPLMLANHYQQDAQQDSSVVAYWVSEKLDGVRAYWNGEFLVSRQGNNYHAPAWFTAALPQYPLDGELWLARGHYEALVSIVRHQLPDDEQWRRVSYQLFDLPPPINLDNENSGETFTKRLQRLKKIAADINVSWVQVIPQRRFKDEAQLIQYLNEQVEAGAEGLMLHRADSYYHAGRSNDVLKLKPTFDDEALVLAYVPGKGKYKNMMGSLLLEMPGGLHFKLGSGFSDKQRRNPPPIGAMVTYEYSGLTKNGIPRFARFLRQRIDF